jgi:hypothetical protein
MKFFSAKMTGDKLSLEDAIVAYIADMGEALKYAFTSPDWKTSISIYSLMIDFLEALANAVMTNKEREILHRLEELFAELETRIELARQDELMNTATESERRSIDEQYDDIIALMQRVERSIKIKYLISCIKKVYKSGEDIFNESMLIRSIVVKFKRYGLDSFMNETEIKEFLKIKPARQKKRKESEEAGGEEEETEIENV